MNEKFYYQKKQHQYRANKVMIMKVAGIDELELHNFILELGCEFIEHNCGDYYHIRDQILFTPGVFWNWWLNHWYLRDQEFIGSHQIVRFSNSNRIAKNFKEYLRTSYLAYHRNAVYDDSFVTNGYYTDVFQKVRKYAPEYESQ